MESSDIKKLENISGLRLLRSICRLGTLSAAAEEQKLSISAASHQLAVMKDFFKELREEGKRKKAEKTEEIKEDSHAGN